MGLRDTINGIKAEHEEMVANQYSDESVYEDLIKSEYYTLNKEIKLYFLDNPKATSFSDNYDIMWHGKGYLGKGLEDIQKYNKNSSTYSIYIDYEETKTVTVYFRNLFERERIGFLVNNTIVRATPLGEKVLKDLKAMAKKDEIEIGEPFVVLNYTTEVLHKNKEKYYRLGEPIPGSPSIYTRSSLRVKLPIKFTM